MAYTTQTIVISANWAMTNECEGLRLIIGVGPVQLHGPGLSEFKDSLHPRKSVVLMDEPIVHYIEFKGQLREKCTWFYKNKFDLL